MIAISKKINLPGSEINYHRYVDHAKGQLDNNTNTFVTVDSVKHETGVFSYLNALCINLDVSKVAKERVTQILNSMLIRAIKARLYETDDLKAILGYIIDEKMDILESYYLLTLMSYYQIWTTSNDPKYNKLSLLRRIAANKALRSEVFTLINSHPGYVLSGAEWTAVLDNQDDLKELPLFLILSMFGNPHLSNRKSKPNAYVKTWTDHLKFSLQ